MLFEGKSTEEGILPPTRLVIQNNNQKRILENKRIDEEYDDGMNFIRNIFKINNTNIIIITANLHYELTYTYNLETDAIRYISPGIGQIQGDNILSHGIKKYMYDKNGNPTGPVWYDALFDLEGHIVKLIDANNEGECIKIKDILTQPKESYTYLNQSFEECVRVER
jgi:hypothetical protein